MSKHPPPRRNKPARNAKWGPASLPVPISVESCDPRSGGGMRSSARRIPLSMPRARRNKGLLGGAGLSLSPFAGRSILLPDVHFRAYPATLLIDPSPVRTAWKTPRPLTIEHKEYPDFSVFSMGSDSSVPVSTRPCCHCPRVAQSGKRSSLDTLSHKAVDRCG